MGNRAQDWFEQAERDLEHARASQAQNRHEWAEIPNDLIEKGKVLDNLYTPTRYPNAHPEGAPFEHYGKLQSEDAIHYASEIVEFVRAHLAGPRNG